MSEEPLHLEVPELVADDLLELDDARFVPENVALVTGAASGIGRATSVALARNGLTVAGLDIDEDGLEGTVELAEKIGIDGEFVPIEADLTDDAAVERAVDRAAEHGTIRYLANVAGFQHIAPLAEFPMEQYDFMQKLMLRAPFLLSKEVLARAQDESHDGVGAIANMSSVHGHLGVQDKPAYITAKHGLNGLTRAIAAEGEGTLRSFTVSVGYVITPLMVDQIAETAEERGISERAVVEDVMLGQARTKELMAPVEVANLFTFGFSEHAGHLNGSDLCFDGGFTTTYD